jgi:capsular polysaccharide biosynthesis protein
LLKAKQALVSTFGVEFAFAVFKEAVTFPDSDELNMKRLESQYAFAKERAKVFVETAPGGEGFIVNAPVVIGVADCRPLEHVARSCYVACLADARVRGRSAVIEVDGMALLDYEPWELDLFDCELDIDPAIFHATKHKVWVTAPKNEIASIDVDEAFMLLGPQTAAFGDWMLEYLPRYVAAQLSGALPPVPVLVDGILPPVHRQSLELMLPHGTEIIEVPSYTTVRVRRLWRGPSLNYAPAREKMDRRFKFDYVVPSPARFAPVAREIASRAASAVNAATGPERVFLARRLSNWRKLVNHAEIAAAAEVRGFFVVYPDGLDFVGQVSLLRHARFIVAPEGSSIYLAYFAQAGTKLCILNHTLVEWSTVYNSYLSGAGVEVTILTGQIKRNHPEFPHRADYQIDEKRFGEFLDQWLEA